jgi:c-di-GMP-binding flagellar brake protein YcgR
MSTFHFRRIERRRTARIAVFVDLTVQGFNENNEKFKIQTRSLSVSGHGGLTVLDAAVTVGQKLFLVNEISKQKAECKVVSLRAGSDGKNVVAFEFATPQPNFWKMTFPASGTKPFRRSLPSSATA